MRCTEFRLFFFLADVLADFCTSINRSLSKVNENEGIWRQVTIGRVGVV